MEIIENLLRASYPLRSHAHHKKIFEKCGKFVDTNLYSCNCCKIKLLGDAELLEHNTSFGHQAQMESHISEMLKKTIQNKYDFGK